MAFNFSGILSFGSATIKVSPDVLVSKASEVENKIGKMRQLFSNIKTSMERTTSYWEGEAGDLHRKQYLDRQDEIDKMLKNLQERVSELNQLAANYTSAESKNLSAASSLATNVIQ